MARAPRPYLQWLARAGYAARGVVFAILAYFTAVAAVDAYTRPVDSKDALAALLLQPLGSVLLFVIAVGLGCFALWREAQAFFDVDRCGSDLKGLARRTVYAAAGLFYAAFASICFSMTLGVHSASTERVVHDWTAWLLNRPMGQALVIAIGGSIVIAGLGIGIAGLRAEFRNRLALKEKPRWIVTALGCAGYLTRAAVFCIIGVFLIFAALHSNAHEATGLAGALLIVKQQAHGGALLAAAALGLLAFGVYGLAEAFFRRIDGHCIATDRPSWMSA